MTITGPGGVGKTRLAIELARRNRGRRPDGVWLVDLASGPGTPDVGTETACILEVRARFGHGLTDILGDEVEAGRQHLKAARAIHGELGVGAGEARSTAALGLTFVMAGESTRARELVELALSFGSAANDGYGQGQCHTYFGILAESSGTDWAGATSHYRQAVEWLRPYRDATLLPVALVGQAGALGRTIQRPPSRSWRRRGPCAHTSGATSPLSIEPGHSESAPPPRQRSAGRQSACGGKADASAWRRRSRSPSAGPGLVPRRRGT